MKRLTLISLVLLFVFICAAQQIPTPVQTARARKASVKLALPPLSAATTTHGLKLILRQDPMLNGSDENSPGQDSLKSCLHRHPLLACFPLTLVLRNEGTDTVLSWTKSCPGVDAWFEIQNREGAWQPFPHGEPAPCTRNALGVQALAPGESYELHLRLADPRLNLDTELPLIRDDYRRGWIKSWGAGYLLLAGQGPHVLRARWNITGCVRAQKEVPQPLNPLAGRSLCLGSKEPEQNFILLQSNELELATERF